MASPIALPVASRWRSPCPGAAHAARSTVTGAFSTAAVAALALAVAALLFLAPAAAATPYGVNVHAPRGSQLGFILGRAQAAGIGWVRIDFIWADVETAPGVFDWSVYDALAAAAAARGVNVFATLAYTPAWATHGAPTTGVPDDPAAWADFCARAARRYASSIHYWGLWNEPNLSRFWSGSRQQYIDHILIPGADAIHQASATARVGGPELAHVASSQWFYWLRDVLGQAAGHLDFVTHHVYDSDGNGGVTGRLNDSTPFGGDPGLWTIVEPSVKEVLKDAGWWGRPFWLTETGWQSGVVSEATQASYYTGLLNDWFTGRGGQSWIDQIFFYEIEDPPSSPPLTWGILRSDGSSKPAYVAYENFITAHTFKPMDDAQLVAATLPASMETGQTITVRLSFKNNGISTWSESAQFRLGAANDQDPFATARQYLAPGRTVAPGQQATFAFDMTAPANPGTYHTQWQMLKEGVARFGDIVARDVVVAAAPPPEQRKLLLQSGRFSTEVSWHDLGSGRAGFGREVGDSDQTGFFWFFDPANLELVVKALDGRPVNGHYWFFYGALSDVEYWITVTDLHTGAVARYYNPQGNLCGGADTSAFPRPASGGGAGAPADGEAAPELAAPGALPVLASPEPGAPPAAVPGLMGEPFDAGAGPAAAADASGGCTPGPQTLCLLGSRFQVRARWQTSTASGQGTVVPQSDQTGTFWFFDPGNVELLVKVIDGRALSGHFWVFYGALSDVQYWVTVTDTATGASKRYHNPAGNICGVGDTSALD
jgi:hypothetical protein